MGGEFSFAVSPFWLLFPGRLIDSAVGVSLHFLQRRLDEASFLHHSRSFFFLHRSRHTRSMEHLSKGKYEREREREEDRASERARGRDRNRSKRDRERELD